jgi:uncharacterized membrane protein (UPF0127 family)
VVAVVAVAVGGSVMFSGSGCEKEQDAMVQTVPIAGRSFHLELALDNDVRFLGLSNRTNIEPDGGMLFVFPRAMQLNFVMRDCVIPIDIIFLDGSGRVVAMHAMVAEDPKGATESATAYDARLHKYSSRFDSQFVIELAGGTLGSLNLAEGQLISLDTEGLKRRAR